MIATPVPVGPVLPPARVGLGRRRRGLGIAAALVGPPLLTAILLPVRAALTLPSHLLLYLVVVVAVALIGGLGPAILAALAATLLLNWFFTPPYGTFRVEDRNQVIALVVFVVVAIAVSAAVEAAGRLAGVATRSRFEAALISDLAGSALEESTPADVLGRLRVTFGLDEVALQQRDHDSSWATLATSAGAGSSPDAVERVIAVPHQQHLRLLMQGPPLFADDRRVLDTFATAAAAALDRRTLAEQAAVAEQLAATDQLRTALLASVGHDLRTPLAAIKAAVSGLRQSDLSWTEDERADLLATIEESTDHLAALVANLLDMSRLQVGAISVLRRPVGLDEVVAAALRSLPLDDLTASIHVDVPDDLPAVAADPGLLERTLANLLSNAVRHGRGSPVTVRAETLGETDRVAIQVVDTGPGIPPDEWERVVRPFQRLDDHGHGSGIGLGLAVARGFVDAMGATLTASTTPGGGLTMTVTLPRADTEHDPPSARR